MIYRDYSSAEKWGKMYYTILEYKFNNGFVIKLLSCVPLSKLHDFCEIDLSLFDTNKKKLKLFSNELFLSLRNILPHTTTIPKQCAKICSQWIEPNSFSLKYHKQCENEYFWKKKICKNSRITPVFENPFSKLVTFIYKCNNDLFTIEVTSYFDWFEYDKCEPLDIERMQTDAQKFLQKRTKIQCLISHNEIITLYNEWIKIYKQTRIRSQEIFDKTVG